MAGLAFAVCYLLTAHWLIAPSERFHCAVASAGFVYWLVAVRALGPHHFFAGLLSIGLLSILAYGLADAGAVSSHIAGYPPFSFGPAAVAARLVLLGSIVTLWRLARSALIAALGRCFGWRRSSWSLPLASGLAAMLAMMPYIFVAFNVHRLKLRSTANPLSQCHLAYRDASFTTRDGLQLAAWLIPCRGSRKAVVVCHGLGANKNVFVDVAPILHRAGYNVLMFDFRGHGDSAGYTTSFGPHEALDVEAAVAYLQGHGFDQIIGYGFSMGGAALLYAVPHLPALRGVVVDSTYADFAPLMAAAARAGPMSAGGKLRLRLVDCYGRLEAGVWPSRIAPRKFIAQVAPRPLFIIHGLADGLIPAAQAQLNYTAAREPKALWLVPSAGHCGCLWANITVYEKRVGQFLRRCQS